MRPKSRVDEIEEVEGIEEETQEEEQPKQTAIKDKADWVLGQVPTQHELVAFNSKTNEQLTNMEILVKILNQNEKILKSLVE